MKTQLLSKQFWLRFSGYFFWYLVLFTVITYLSREKDEQFWSISNLSDKIAFALFMALLFAVWNPQNKQTSKLQSNSVVSKPTLKEFFGTYLIILLFMLPILVVLTALGWGIIELFSHNDVTFWPVLLKSLIVTSVLCLLTNVFFSVSQLISFKRQKKNL
jgi:hypothetical protein